MSFLRKLKKSILLFGGSGLVGRNIQEHDRAGDWNIVAPTRREVDLMDAKSVQHFIKKQKPDLIIHAAGLVGGIQANVANPIKFLDENLVMGRNIIMAAYECAVPELINLASSCMYPVKGLQPFSEEAILTGDLEPTNEGYALAKIVGTRLCQYINSKNLNLQYKTIIPCNIYGRHDKFDTNSSHLIAAIISKIHNAKERREGKVWIWGAGTARREFIYAGDVADAILFAASDLSVVPEVVNIGIGSDYSIKEYYEVVKEVLSWDGEFKYDKSKPVGMEQKLSNLSRQKIWGWKAKTPIKEGIKYTYDFFLESKY